MKKYLNRKALSYALFNPEGLPFLLMLAFGVTVLIVYSLFVSFSLLRTGLILSMLTAASITVRQAMLYYFSSTGINQIAMLRIWAKTAGTAAERKRRDALIDSNGVANAFALAGLSGAEPSFNTNGSLMLEGYGIDYTGQAIGATLGTFQYHEEADVWANPMAEIIPIDIGNDIHMM